MAWFRCKFRKKPPKYEWFPMFQNKNGHFSEQLKANIDSIFDTANNYVFVYYQYYNPNSGYGRYYYYYLKFPKTSTGKWYGEPHNNLYQFYLQQVGTTNFTQGGFYCDRRTPSTIEGVSSSSQTGSWMQNLDSSNYNSSKDYISNFEMTDSENSSILQYP